MRNLFSEKEKELAVALAKVDALTRQLDELRHGDTSNSYVMPPHLPPAYHVEFDKLRQELLVSVNFIDLSGRCACARLRTKSSPRIFILIFYSKNLYARIFD